MPPSPSASIPSSATHKNRPSSNGQSSGQRPSHTRDSANSGAGNLERRQATPSESTVTAGKSSKKKKNRHRKRRNRRQSFLGPEESPSVVAPASVPETEGLAPMATDQTKSRAALPFYKLGRDLSSTSLESEALLDHRNQPLMRPRRDSRLAQSFRPGTSLTGYHPSDSNTRFPLSSALRGGDDSDGPEAVDDRTPLIRPASEHKPMLPRYGTDSKSSPFSFRHRRKSNDTTSSRCSPRAVTSPAFPEADREYDINNPPSIPTTPKLGPEIGYDDAVVTGTEFGFSLAKSIDNRRDSMHRPHDMVIDMDDGNRRQGSPPSPHSTQDALRRRRTLAPEEDVCFPAEVGSELAEEDEQRIHRDERRRRRRREWPDLSVLEEWSREEKEERTGDFRTKKISEPMLIEGRLRPQYRLWRRDEDDVPYRFTYFNEEFHSTIHAQTISELVQPGGSFRELFIPNPPELDDSSDEDEGEEELEHPVRENMAATNIHNLHAAGEGEHRAPTNGNSHENGNDRKQVPRASIISEAVSEARTSADVSPARRPPLVAPPPKPKRYGPRPTFWLDVLSPTDAEMRVIAKAFGIHALTAEDIMMQEAREKVELFRNYYFVNYRTFEQDVNNENYLQPVNMYVVVFRDGIISFHFSQTPHPANVRRRIRQLMDYLILSSDWISYALIDDITDVFGPLIQSIEDEVDEIDEMIMKMHSTVPGSASNDKDESSGDESNTVAPGEMLRRVGVCRKKVMGMYRLLSNKADVVKGFAKRCNEQWEVAPKSEIGLYLGDIQDHIMTMTSSLTYYETLLSRAHSNYLAQINILMNERQEQTADVLGKLTVLGTIVLPLNIICGMWGMNVKVPGQDVDSLTWFWSITAGLVLFAFASFLIAKRVYKIV